MKSTQLLGVLALLMLFACKKDQDSLDGLHASAPAFSLSDPQTGQVARFERIQLSAGGTIPTIFRDTLLLEIMAANSMFIEVEERLSDGSASQSGFSAVPFPGHTFHYRLSPKPASLSIETTESDRLESRLFPSLTEQNHSLSYQSSAEEAAKLEGLRVQTPYLPVDRTYSIQPSEEVLVANLMHDGRQNGLPGFTFVHDREVGLRFMLVEVDLAGNASGWQLIE